MKKTKMQKGLAVLVASGTFLMMAAASGSDTDTVSKVGEVTQQTTANQPEAEKNNSSAEQAVSTEEEKNNSSAEQAVSTEEETQPVQTEFHVGDILETNELKIVYVSSGEYVSDNQFIQPKEGNHFIFLEFYFENISDSDKNVSSYSFKCYADGYACDSSYSGESSLSATLSSGRSTSGKIYFEVPNDASDIQIEYETNAWTQKKATFIYEGTQDSGFVSEANTASAEETFKPGDIIETKDLIITYLSCNEYISDNEFIQPKEGYHYLYCELEFENISDSDNYVSYFDFDCFADGASCDAFYGMDNGLNATLSPGRKTKGTVAFEVPVDAQTVEFEFLTNLWTSNRIVFSYVP